MATRKACLAVGVLLLLGVGVFGQQRHEQVSRQRLEELSAALENDQTRMSAVCALIAFAGDQLYMQGSVRTSGGDPEKDRLMREAGDILLRWVNVETIGKALSDPERSVQWWALTYFPKDPDNQETWASLVPKLQQLAIEGDTNIRVLAVEDLRWYPQARDFLDRRIKEETSPEVLMRLMRPSTGGELYRQRVCRRVVELLRHDDPEVRKGALSFIALNSNRAPMWQFPFGPAVFARVIELTRSPLNSERTAAIFALQELDHLDPATARATMLEMAGDPYEGVRQQVARGLAVEADRADVRAALIRLLDDPAVGVRYQAIRALGPEKHVEQLKEISRGGDPRYADWAAALLKRLEQQRENDVPDDK
ncbi:MAG: HEAT repeat domain-containing protein [Planctomycetes bacterium]|nr:HEAT repeat domain-containing protein [Planctomycetota bacterium]